jgi:hypothetical protein
MRFLTRLKAWFADSEATRHGARPPNDGSTADGDYPFSLYDISWLAVKTSEAEGIIDVLGLSDPEPVTWRQGISAVCGDYWDSDAPLDAVLSRVYITPVVEGWRLAIGGWVGEGGWVSEGGVRGFDGVAEYCRTLSKRYGEAHAFTSQGRMGWYSWVLARDGDVYRRYFLNTKREIDEGSPTPAEQSDAGSSGENSVMAIAGECSVDPRAFSRDTPFESEGLLAITAWGCANGVPERPLE